MKHGSYQVWPNCFYLSFYIHWRHYLYVLIVWSDRFRVDLLKVVISYKCKKRGFLRIKVINILQKIKWFGKKKSSLNSCLSLITLVFANFGTMFIVNTSNRYINSFKSSFNCDQFDLAIITPFPSSFINTI